MPTPYIKQTWSDDSLTFPVTAARMTVIEQGIYDAHYRPVCRAYATVVQAIPNNVETTITLSATRFDTDTIFTPSRLTAHTAGYYQITAQLTLASASVAAARAVRIRLNGATYIGVEEKTTTAASQFTHMSCSTLYLLSAGDYVEMRCSHAIGAPCNTYVGVTYTPEFMMALVSYA